MAAAAAAATKRAETTAADQVGQSALSSNKPLVHGINLRFKSTSPESESDSTSSSSSFAFDENGEAAAPTEMISFPVPSSPSSDNDPAASPGDHVEYQPILLNAKEHAVGYLSRILNARVYEAAIETELQHAKNLSTVRME